MKNNIFRYVVNCYDDGALIGTEYLDFESLSELKINACEKEIAGNVALEIFEKYFHQEFDFDSDREIGPEYNALGIRGAIVSGYVCPFRDVRSKFRKPYYVAKAYKITNGKEEHIFFNAH